MYFETIENIRHNNRWDSFKGLSAGVLKILLFTIFIPFLLIGLVVKLFKNNDSKKTSNELSEFYQRENLILNRLFINENEIPNNIDYPKVADDIFLFQIESEPEIEELNNKFFDHQFVEIEQGILLLSFNQKDEGMSVWFIDNKSRKMHKVRDLQSSSWNFGNRDGAITLQTTLNKKDIKIEMKQNRLQ